MRLPPSLLAVACLTALAAPAAAGERQSRGRLYYTLATRDRDQTDAEREVVGRRLMGERAGAAGRLLGSPDAVSRDRNGRTSLKYLYLHSTLIVVVDDGRVVSVGWTGNGRSGLPE